MNYNPIAYYCGKFSPPTLLHLNTALSLERRKEIYQVIIVIAPGELSLDQKDELWKILLNTAVTANISVEKSTGKSSLMHVYEKLMKQPDTACYLALDEESARKEEFKKHFNKFPHVEIELVPSQFTGASKKVLKSIENGDTAALKTLLPEDISKEDMEAYINVLKKDTEAPDENSEELRERYINMFNGDFWKGMLGLNETKTEVSLQLKENVNQNTKIKQSINEAKAVNDNKETYKKWKSLVNMSSSELGKFYNSKDGKEAGLSSGDAKEKGIDSGRESARWILKMKKTPQDKWTPAMWKWANKQISFISRMSGNKGGLYDDKGNKTRKHTSLLIWGHNPERKSYNESYSVLITESTEYKTLEKNKVPLTPEEREEVMKSKAIWHHGPKGAPSPAVWKSKGKDGKFTYVTATHRAFNTAKTLKGAISRYHKFIKGTA